MGQLLFGTLGPLPGAAEIVSSAGWSSIAMFALGAAVSLAYDAHERLRYLYRRWRLDRRLAKSGPILREELNEYRLGMGEEPEPIHPARLFGRMLLSGLFAGLPLLLGEFDLLGWFLAALVAIFAGSTLARLWRRFNDPPELRQPLWPEVTVPQESVLGALSAAAIVLFLLAVLFWLI